MKLLLVALLLSTASLSFAKTITCNLKINSQNENKLIEVKKVKLNLKNDDDDKDFYYRLKDFAFSSNPSNGVQVGVHYFSKKNELQVVTGYIYRGDCREKGCWYGGATMSVFTFATKDGKTSELLNLHKETDSANILVESCSVTRN